MSWIKSLRLPKTTFPPRPDVKLRQTYIERCTDKLYKWQEDSRAGDKPFIVHDGPPYANGDLHVGHAMNKVLKDLIIRFKVQQGRRVKYIPGWDCHGLPIELKALEKHRAESPNETLLSPTDIRKHARQLASDTVSSQMQSFRRFAVMADWDKRWTTMDHDFEIRQLRLFQKMVKKGLVHRKFKPVYWSPSSHTALAEAELEYTEKHVSLAAYVKFAITIPEGKAGHEVLENIKGPLYALIWTTTPWTLPANKGIAVSKDMTYVILKVGGENLIIGEDCLDRVMEKCFPGDEVEREIVGVIDGAALEGLTYVNNLRGKEAKPQLIYTADFVTPDSGSGLVHMAPGHGFEDYEFFKAAAPKTDIGVPVDGKGCFTEDAFPDRPSELTGLPVFKEGTSAVLKLLGSDAVKVHRFTHKYPYDWRTKQPVIIRSTSQWFADVGVLKEQALASIRDVNFLPATSRRRLESFIEGRSEWCISRQRAWGVPIPVLLDKDGNALLDDDSMHHVIKMIEERGTDAWWTDKADAPEWTPPALAGMEGLRRGRDTMDVWFDSGSSWTGEPERADVYLEGSDQHRGWFQSSLLTSIADKTSITDGKVQAASESTASWAPFKNLITHGFTLDEKRRKMSKSLGNIIHPHQVMDGTLLPPLKMKQKSADPAAKVYNDMGPDILRLWVCGTEFTSDTAIGKQVLETMNTNLVKFRTIIKMLLGSLHPQARTAPLTALDRIALVQLRDVMAEYHARFDRFDFPRAHAALVQWVATDLSAFYLEALKDRLYCGDGGGAVPLVLEGLLRMLAPVAPVLVEEALDHAPAWFVDGTGGWVHPGRQVFMAPLVGEPAGSVWEEEEQRVLRAAMPVIRAAHGAVKAAAERARKDKRVGSSLQCRVVITPAEDGQGHTIVEGLRPFAEELATMFVVSAVELGQEHVPADADVEWVYTAEFAVGGGKATAHVLPPREHKCPRCWRYLAPREEELCGRCEGVVGEGGEGGEA